jgi:hypothetical protein
VILGLILVILFALLGWKIGPKILKIKFFKSIVSITSENLKLFKYGLDFNRDRFIPFGVRNGLFSNRGLGKMDV